MASKKDAPAGASTILGRHKVSMAEPANMTTSELLTCAARLNLAKREVEADEEAVAGRLAEIEGTLIERMVAEENQRSTVLGITIYIRNEIWASATDVLGLKKWLQRNKAVVKNANSIVKESANTQTLSALVREMVTAKKEELGPKAIGKKLEDLLPKGIVPLLKLSEKVKLGFLKAN